MSQRITVRPRICPSHRSESPNSVPTTSSASLSAAAFCSARSRIDAPTESGCASSTTPLPLTVVATGAPSASASAVTSACASTAPPPAMIIGWAAAASTLGRPADGVRIGLRCSGFRAQLGHRRTRLCSSTSKGISMCTGRGPAAGEAAERLGHRGGRLVGAAHPSAPAHQLIHCAQRVLGLVQLAEVAALGAGGQARRQHQHRLRFRVGGRRGGHHVGQPGATGGHHNPGPAGDPRIGLGRIARALLVPGRDGADAGRRQVPVDLQVVGAGDAEDGVDAVRGKGFDDGRATVAMPGHDFAASTEISS